MGQTLTQLEARTRSPVREFKSPLAREASFRRRMEQRRFSAVAAVIVLTSSLLIAGCGGSSSVDSIPTTTAESDQGRSLRWSDIGLDALDVERTVTVIVPGRKCWAGSIESRTTSLGSCGSHRTTFINENIGTVRAWKNVRAPFPLTLIVEHDGHEIGRATTTEPFGKVEVPG